MIRQYLLGFFATCVLLWPIISEPARGQSTQPSINHPALAKLGWQLACRSSTFEDMTFADMAHMLHGMTVHHIELSPGQVLSNEHQDIKIGPQMTDAETTLLQLQLKASHLDVVSVGPISLTSDNAADQQLFVWASKLHAKNIMVEGMHADQFDAQRVETLAANLNINVVFDGGQMRTATIPPDAKHLGLLLNLSSEVPSTLLASVHELQFTDTPPQSAAVDAILARLKAHQFKGIFAISATGRSSQERLQHFVDAVTAFSQSVTRISR